MIMIQDNEGRLRLRHDTRDDRRVSSKLSSLRVIDAGLPLLIGMPTGLIGDRPAPSIGARHGDDQRRTAFPRYSSKTGRSCI